MTQPAKARKPGPKARANLRAKAAGAALGWVTAAEVVFPKRRRGQEQSFNALAVKVELYFPARGKRNERLMKAFSRLCGRYDIAHAVPVRVGGARG